MDRVFIAVYIDLENVANTKLKLDDLMKTFEDQNIIETSREKGRSWMLTDINFS